MRAEPVAALFEQGKVHLVGSFPLLEDQLTGFTPDMDRAKSGSPDPADSMICAMHELIVEAGAYAGLFSWLRGRDGARRLRRENIRARSTTRGSEMTPLRSGVGLLPKGLLTFCLLSPHDTTHIADGSPSELWANVGQGAVRGGKIDRRDRWYGLEGRSDFSRFRRWWHRQGKQAPGVGDLESREQAAEAYAEWEGQGKPDS